jgi:hypothetical protein
MHKYFATLEVEESDEDEHQIGALPHEGPRARQGLTGRARREDAAKGPARPVDDHPDSEGAVWWWMAGDGLEDSSEE